ncbi:uncharacterized protein [Salminus brasiliensis]|uniref:uncharacterized protein isoform X2 n=1 Tax=Salminus brasiliensis TaxID=930266 RepID=UPI003B83708A
MLGYDFSSGIGAVMRLGEEASQEMSKMSKPDQTSPNVYTDTKKKMKPFQLTCQNCDELYGTMKDFKIHVRSYSHKKEVAQLFQTAVHQGLVFFPIIVVLNYLRDSSSCDPLIGLDMVTLCITPEKYGSFYLCHVCEERLSSQDVVKHLCSVDHYFKYLAYRNPELLRFAWFKNSFSYLQSSAKEENHINGSGTLRVLELPKMMLKRGKKMAYYQVMAMFSKMDKVTERVRANRPRRKTLQAYITDPVRMNPLLGLNFLLEFSCPDSEWHCGYLCILCRQKVSAIESISHCISFDHVYWYMNDAHPATLECTKSSYTNYSYSFNKKILYLANLAQKENPPGEIESMHLDWSGFKEVDSSSYTNALSKLQQLRLERVQGEFKASVVPGEQFVYPPDTHVSCMAPTDDSTEQEAEVVRRESAQNGGSGPFILCVECNQTLSYISNYKKHIKGSEHKQKLAELFGPGLYSGPITDIQLYHYLWSHFGKVSSHPLIGLHLLTVFVDRWSQGSSPALYLCHACEINISSASTHLTSTQHYVNVFAHTKPDLVFLGSQNSSQVTKFAQEEELRQRKELILRVCEIPSHLWRKFKCLSYERIMAAIEKHNSKLSRCIEVQQRVTLQSYAKSSDRKSPLVGLQYMVKYSTTQPFPKCGYLCLLCERKLPEMHAIVHILSFTHIFAYLNIAHPGSLSKDDHEQTSLIVDLAQQAEAISPEKTLQEVELQFGKFHEVDTNPFKAALSALQSVFKQQGLGELTPSLVPGARLVSSVKKDCQKDSLQCIKQESSDSSHTQSSTSITDLKSLGLVPKCTERLRTTSPATNMLSAKPSPAASTCTEFPVASFNAPQPDLLEMDTNPVSPAVPSPHTTVAKAFCTMSKPLQTLDLSFTEQQSKPAQDSGKPSEASEKLRQSSTCLKNKERDVSSVEKHCQKDSLRCIKQESSPTDLKSHGLVPKCTERLRTTSPASLDSTNMLSAEPSLTASTCTEFPVVSFNAPQPDLLEMDTDPVSPAVPSPHTTEAKAFCTMSKPLQTLDLSFTEQQSKPAQDSGEPSEASEKLRQSSTCLKNKERDVPQIPPASNILWNYMKTSIREPVIGLNSVIECHTDGQPPLYFCVSCTKTLKEISIIEHLTGRDHQKVYLKSVKYAPLLAKKKVKTKWLRSHAIMVEWSGGAGKTQVLELDAEDYHNLLSAPNLAALTKLRDSLLKISSEISDKNTAEASSSDVSRCDERLETSAIKTDGPCDAIRETVITDDSKCDTTLKHNSDALRSSPHLWAYLTSPKRTQPVIGLSMITEYRSFSGHNSFLCSCCKVVLSTSSYIGHLISPRHRFSYMKVKHPKLVEMWKGQFSLSCKISELEAKAHIVQDLEGWGHIKVVENDCPKKKEHIATGAENSTNEQELEASQTSGETKQQGQSHLKSTKLPKKEKMKKQTALIGVNFVTCVTHGKKKLFFCELCSVRCHLDHMSSVSHRKACVEHKYPGWTTSDAHMEKKLNKIALHLAAAERSTGIEMKKLTVPAKVFTALRTAPASEAMSELKLQLTKLKAQLDPRGSLACPEPNCKTASYHTEGKFAAAIPSLQQEQAPLPEMSVMPDTTENPQRGSHSWTVQSPAEPCSTHCLKPSVTHSTLTFSVTLPPLPPPVPDLPPFCSFSSIPLAPPVPNLPPDSSQPVTLTQSLSSPQNTYESVCPPPLCEPVSPSSLSVVAPLYSPTSPSSSTPLSENSSTLMLLPLSAKSHFKEGEDQAAGRTLGTVLSETWPRPQPSSAELKSAGESQLVSTHSICFEERRSTQTYNSLTFPIVTGHSNAYVFLSLRNLFRTEPIIGLSDIVECRAMSRPTFFLCLNCAEKISAKNFCCHMTSEHHQHCSILRRIPDPGIFQKWQINDKLTLRDLAGRLALMEQGFDAKVIKLDQKQYEILQSADFLNAIEMLQRMYGPIAGYNFLSSIRTGQNQKAPLQQDRSETDENTPEHQPLQSCDLNPSQTQPRLHHSPVADRAFDRVQDNECTKISSPIKDQSQLSQSPEKTWKVSKTGVQAQAEPTQLQLKTDITAESDRDSGKETQTIPETHRTESTTLGVQHFLPSTIKIKQEKPDYGEVSPNKCCFGVNTATSLDAPHSGEFTVNPSKHKADLINSVNSKRESKSDAVVGLSSVIECRSNGQPSLYLCVACSSKLNHDLIINHLMKLGHRESYLRHRYPWFFENWPDSDTRTQRSVMLMQLAHQVEKTYEDEPGQPQEMELQCADLKEIKSLSYDKAIMQLQKIRKAQNLCALQTCISPKKQPVLVKQEKIETEVTTRHSPPPADLPEKTAQTPRTVSKRRNTEPDSSHMSPTVVKQIKLSSSLTSIEEMIKQPKLQTCDNQMPDPPSRHSSKTRAPENTIIEVSSKESLPQGHTNLKTKTKHKDKQSPSQFNADQTHVTCSSSAVSATRHINKYSHSTHKPTTSTKSSKKSEVQTKSEVESSAKTLKDHRSASNPQLIAQIPSGICSDKVALNEQSGSNISKTCLKRHCSESKAVSSLPRKKHFTGDPSSHLKQSPLVPDSPVPSESAIRRKTLDERLADFTHLQNSLSISLTFLSEGIQKSHPNVSGDPDPCTPAEMVPSYQPLNKTSILAPQQKHPCPSSSASSDPAMQAQGHEIARLHETSKKAQNYENQQFIPETLNTNLVAASSVESDWTITANEAVTSAYASTESSPMSYHIPPQNAHLYFSMTSNTSVTSPVIPGYAVPPQYFWYQQPDYVSPSASTIAHNYTVAVNENATNAEAVPPGHSANLGYLTNANSAYTSQVVNQSQVYPPVQSVQPPETLQAYHPFYAYNQGLQPDQVTTFSGSVTSAASANGHVPTG